MDEFKNSINGFPIDTELKMLIANTVINKMESSLVRTWLSAVWVFGIQQLSKITVSPYSRKPTVIGSGKWLVQKLNNDISLVAFVFLCCGAFYKPNKIKNVCLNY